MDSGAEVSLISKRAFMTLKNKPKIVNKKAHLQSVNGNSLHVDGCVELKFRIGQVQKSHNFYVVSNINRNVILGRDFLSKNGVRLYFDLECMKIDDSYVPLEEDIKIASIVRLQKGTVLKPQTSYRPLDAKRSQPTFYSYREKRVLKFRWTL